MSEKNNLFSDFESSIEEVNKPVSSGNNYMNVELRDNDKLPVLVDGLKSLVFDKGRVKANQDNKNFKQLYMRTCDFNKVLSDKLGLKTGIRELGKESVNNDKIRNVVSRDISGIRNAINTLEDNLNVYAKKNSDYKTLRIEYKK